MADGIESSSQADPTSPSSVHDDASTGTVTGTGIDYDMIAQAVETLLKPMIQEAVESSLHHSLQ